MKLFTKRNLLGALLFLIFVGEPTVGLYSGLFFGPGMIVLAGLYLTLFWLYEALIVRYKLTYAQLVPLTFAIYSVLITGLLHGELANYLPHIQNGKMIGGQFLITTMIRIQCSLFPIFAYYLLNRYAPRNQATAPSVKVALAMIVGWFLVLTPTHKFGFWVLADTFHKVPIIALGFSVAAVLALIYAFKPAHQQGTFVSKNFAILTWSMLVVACIPSIITLLVLLIMMPIVTAVYWRQPAFRHAKA